MKLYKVTLRGMTTSQGIKYGISYVVADDPQEAYIAVKDYLDKKDLGFQSERELSKIELIAEDSNYPNCETKLYLPTIIKD